MRKTSTLFTSTILLLIAAVAGATVHVPVGPTSLLTSPRMVKAQSDPIGLFEFTLTQDAAETLSSVTIRVNNLGVSTLTSADFAGASVYKDNGDGSFNSTTDLLAGSQGTVNIGSDTTISTGANNTLTGNKFFVALRTAAAWNSTPLTDTITVQLPAYGIVTSANSPTVATTTTSLLIADTVAPQLVSVKAFNTSNTGAKEAGDSIVFTFSEATNKPAITAGNVTSTLAINNGHSLLNGAGVLGTTSWNTGGTELTLTFTGTSTPPTAHVGDTAQAIGSLIHDSAGNNAAGTATITGSFGTTFSTSTPTSTDLFARFKKFCGDNGLTSPTSYKKLRGHEKRIAQLCRRINLAEAHLNKRLSKLRDRLARVEASLKTRFEHEVKHVRGHDRDDD